MHFMAPFIRQNLKNILRENPELREYHHIPAKNGVFAPPPLKNSIFQKPINQPRSLNSCLSTFKKSKSDVAPLMKY